MKKERGREKSYESLYLPNRFLPSRHEKIRGAFTCKQTKCTVKRTQLIYYKHYTKYKPKVTPLFERRDT